MPDCPARSLITIPIELYWLSKYCLGIDSKSQKAERVYTWRQHLKLNISNTECNDFKVESKVVSVEAVKEHWGVYLQLHVFLTSGLVDFSQLQVSLLKQALF